ncbi:MAG: efflux RND transporter permease subunit [Chromatiales bacterium]|jgi:multidrug efflux pump subunit AcrB
MSRQQRPGLAGRLAGTFIRSPLSLLILLGLFGFGLIGLLFAPRQEDPQISVPLVDIFLQFPGATTEQVENLAVEPLERLMSEIPGVKHVYSMSSRAQGLVTVRFEVGEPMGPSIVKVYQKVMANLDRMPPGVKPPLIQRKGIDDVPIVCLTLWSRTQNDAALRQLADSLLQRLKQIPDTGEGFVAGGREQHLKVRVDPSRLAAYGLSLEQVAGVIHAANRSEDVGAADAGDVHFQLYAGGFLHSADEVARLLVGIHNGEPVFLGDIARVNLGPETPDSQVTYYSGAAGSGQAVDGAAAVTLAIAKKSGSNGVAVARAILDRVESLQGTLIPADVQVAVTRNYGKTAEDKVNELVFKLFVATSLVTLLVLLALGPRPAVVVTLIIPMVILITVFAAWVMGYSINRVSLFAFIFAIGILVDDAIVVVENIYRRWLLEGRLDVATAVDAVREVGNPTVIATLTVVAALLPMAFVRGMMGPYMQPIPVLGSMAMLFSLFAAFALTPWLTLLLKPQMRGLQRSEQRETRVHSRLAGLYTHTLLPLLRHGWLRLGFIGLLGIGLVLSIGMLLSQRVTVKMLPYDNKPELDVVLDLPAGTALPITANATREMVEKLRTIPEVTAIQVYEGTPEPFDFNSMVRHYYLRRQPWQAQIHVQLVDKHKRNRSSHQIAQAVRQMLQPIGKTYQARLSVVEMPPGPPVLQTLVAEVYGPDQQTIHQVAGHLMEEFKKTKGVSDINTSMQRRYPVWRFHVNADKARRRGVSVQDILKNLRLAMGGEHSGDIKQAGLEPTWIVIGVPYGERSDLAALEELPIPSSGGSIPLGELGRFERQRQEQAVFHKDLRPLEYVMGDAVGRLDSPIYPMLRIDRALADYRSPDGATLSGTLTGPPPADGHSAFAWTGAWTVTYETFRDLGLAFAVALLMIYFLLVMEFRNFRIPLVIMAPIPLTLLGIIPGHWLLGAEFTATSMIGFIALAGIIVRNSILLVDFALLELVRGIPLQEALLGACQARTRPILITALALVGGSAVILTDPIFQGMAVSLLFGVLVSTLLTLAVVPLGCQTIQGAMLVCRNENIDSSQELNVDG